MLVLLLFSIPLYYLPLINAIPGHVLQDCVLLGSKVFCYGGYSQAANGGFTNMTNMHISTDLSQATFTEALFTPNWNIITSANPPPIENRAGFGMTPLDNTRYMILGGAHLNDTVINPAVIYDSNANTWTACPAPPFYGFQGTLEASDPNTVWGYGGQLNASTNPTPANTLKFDLTTAPGLWTLQTNSANKPATSRFGHASVIRGGTISYFGGFMYAANPTDPPTPIPFTQVAFYNTVTDIWGMVNAVGDIPESRQGHTVTLINNSSKVLIYGGTSSTNLQAFPLLNYTFVHDLGTHNYTRIDFGDGPSAGPRYDHSAVAYKQYVLILFGNDSGGGIQNTTYVLDVSNPLNPQWVGNVSDPSPLPSYPPSSYDGHESTGAIVGGVIGAVAFLAVRTPKKKKKDYVTIMIIY
ncbi:uncharacterized protein BX664DRAFT_19248 [Halteromyces radiatus]|uniref:uncharacterized protein n=1 Tax=Halteromyces radiatus TaxID=101107 RepID=UPI0022204C8E|nr:uncharacterized protein BX664DRAFT_19248 [Halteromyces radiatus]KAI8099355.1 hypothetical protein BX664DRAFT_19248 [Halteromyces radiatus]